MIARKTQKEFPEINFFGDVVTAHIDADYKEGKFYNYYTDEEIKLAGNPILDKGIMVRIIAPLASVNSNDKNQTQKLSKTLFTPGTILFFKMEYIENEKKHTLEFSLATNANLVIERIGNKFSKLKSCDCTVINGFDSGINKEVEDFEPIKCNSLNQAFLKASIKYRPENASHVCNVFKTFRTNQGIFLEEFRWDL
jgi:hypothetical protein